MVWRFAPAHRHALHCAPSLSPHRSGSHCEVQQPSRHLWSRRLCPRRRPRRSTQHTAAMRTALLSMAAVAMALPRLASAAAASAASASSSDGSLFAWWGILQHGSRSDILALLSPRWWIAYIAAEFEAEPAHVIVETACILTIIYLLVLRKPAPMQQEKMSRKEEEELIADWKPEPLCPVMPASNKTRFVVESATGRSIRANGTNFLNFASTNFLGLADKPEIKAACRETIDRYGVGSCGPRGFYGTFDVHLEIESKLAAFMGAEECILYSDAIASISSVIPAFAKKGDVIVVDSSASFAIQQGCLLSRSDIVYFKHDDMADLERVLAAVESKSKAQAKKKNALMHRRFIVVEGVSSIDGSIAPMPQIVRLKNQYKMRLIMDDSLGFGVLGAKGRGTLEHHGMAVSDVDAVCAAMDGALSSVGGFCVGSHQVVDHQRLSGAGYCFSASSPPYTSTASIQALALMEAEPKLGASLRAKAQKVRAALASVHKNLVVLGGPAAASSAVIHLALKSSAPASDVPASSDVAQLDALNAALLADGVMCSVPEFIPADHAARKASLRIILSTVHTDADVDKLIKAIATAAANVIR